MLTTPFVGIHPEIPYNDEDQIAIFGQQPQRVVVALVGIG